MGYDQERRKNKRLPISLHLEVSHMFRQDYSTMKDFNADLWVVDISKRGIGFESESSLPVDYYFNGKVEINRELTFYTVLKVVRKEMNNSGKYIYGAEFIGLAPVLEQKIEQYQQ